MVNLPVKVVHLDDDPGAVKMLRTLLSSDNRVEYLNGFSDVEGLYHYLRDSSKPDVLFLDVKMPGKDGLQIAKELAHSDIEIIFITAYAEYAVKAFEACAVDYLLKPVSKNMLEEALDRFYLRKIKKQRNVSGAQLKELFTNYLGNIKQPRRIFVSMLGKVQIIDLDQVLYFSSIENYTHIHMENGDKYVSSKPLRMYYDVLDNHSSFVRINRSAVVNKHHVKHLLRDGPNHNMLAVISDGTELKISYNNREAIFQQLMS